MGNTVFLVWNKNDYFYKWEPKCMSPCRMKSSRIRPVGKVCRMLHMDAMPGCFIKKEVKQAEKIVLTDTVFDFCLYNRLKKCCGEEKLFLYYMNLIGPENREYMKAFPNRVCSFDKEDAERFGIGYRHLPYSGKAELSEETPQYDTFFLGTEKERTSGIRKAACVLETSGLRAKIMVLNGSDPQYRIGEYIPYPEYLKYLSKSRTILEISRAGQDSCSLRFLESLFLGKKLITDNPQIITDPYYDPENVFILGKDDLRELPDFVMRPYRDRGLDLSGLSFENWIEDWQQR